MTVRQMEQVVLSGAWYQSPIGTSRLYNVLDASTAAGL